MSSPYTTEHATLGKQPSRFLGLHPLVAAAAVSVIALSGVGIATMLMNRSDANTAANPAIVAALPAADAPVTPAVTSEPAPAAQPAPEVVPVPAPKVVSKPVHKATQVAAANTVYSDPVTPVYNTPVNPPSPPVAQAPAICRECAIVEATREIKVEGQGSGLGAIAGGVVGGLLGNRVGAGNGKALATVLGAVGGGYAGNSIEKSTKAGVEYQLVVRYEDGTSQTFKRNNPWPFASGDHVKVVDNQVVRG